MTLRDRLQASGIRRLGGPRSGFRYRRANGRAVSRAELARIRALGIPPAWRDVAIAESAQARLQAIGQDAAGRWQYLYGAAHVEKSSRAKFDRLLAFGAALPILRRALRRDLTRPGLPLEKAQACSLMLLSACALRPGAEVYARQGTYGLATLRPGHIEIKGDNLRLHFRGKHGVMQDHSIRNRVLARMLREMKRMPGLELLKYRDEQGQVCDIRHRHINAYVKESMGRRFSARDFRTWAATLLCGAALRREAQDGTRSRERAIAHAVKETAGRLGNTPAVVRASYIHPRLIVWFRQGRVVTRGLARHEALMGHRHAGLDRSERALLALLRNAPRERSLVSALRSSRRLPSRHLRTRHPRAARPATRLRRRDPRPIPPRNASTSGRGAPAAWPRRGRAAAAP